MFYKLAKIFFGIRSRRVKLLSIAGAHVAGLRYIGVYLDPVLACNLRCKMCYFSDDKSRPRPEPPMTAETARRVARLLFRRAAKVQIGCAAEPTLYRELPDIIALTKEYGVPYTEITTNGQLLTRERLESMIEAGLDGMTLSIHGTRRDTYEHLMGRASFDRLLALVETLRAVKQAHPTFSLRLNYTLNHLNYREVAGLWDLFKGIHVDVMQIRPIQRLGDTEYSDFDLQEIIDNYDSVIAPFREHCRTEGTMFIGPTSANLRAVDSTRHPLDEAIEDATYYYVGPTGCRDLDLEADTFGAYHRRRHTLRRWLRQAFGPAGAKVAVDGTKKMNYQIK